MAKPEHSATGEATTPLVTVLRVIAGVGAITMACIAILILRAPDVLSIVVAGTPIYLAVLLGVFGLRGQRARTRRVVLWSLGFAFALACAAVVGGCFIGPLLHPDSNLAHLSGVLIGAPVGFPLGGVVGALVGLARRGRVS